MRAVQQSSERWYQPWLPMCYPATGRVPTNYFTLTRVMQITHLINTKFGITILYAAFQIPLAVFIIYGFVDSIPRELDEAAIIDGCGPLSLFTTIILPLLTPVLVTT